jgi:ATP-dependent DNA helicase Rep
VSLANAADDVTLLKQLPARAAAGLHEFNSIVNKLRDAAERVTPAELVAELAEKSGLIAMLRAQCKDVPSFERRKANLDELAQWFASVRGNGPGELAAQLALLSNADRGEPGNQVRLMSLHAAKGLEFAAVFIVGCEDGNLPHEASIEEGRLEEERRLLYVGITRAKQRLVLSHCAEAKRWGNVEHLLPSRFLDELPAGDLRRDGGDPEAEGVETKQRGRAHMADIAALLG